MGAFAHGLFNIIDWGKMRTRSTLRSQLKEAWKSTIELRYNDQLINSEHGLQAYFCAELLNEFKDMTRRIFIEPKMSFPNGQRRHPDLVICDSKSIIGIVEFKYVPRGRPTHAKDFETLQLAVKHADSLKISNDRFRGVVADDRSYSLSPTAVLCWAAIYTGEAVSLKAGAELGKHFLQLDATTTKGKNAKVK